MEFINLVGAVSGCSSILGFLALIVNAIEHKHDTIADCLNKNNELLAEIKVKVDLLYKEKTKRSKP